MERFDNFGPATLSLWIICTATGARQLLAHRHRIEYTSAVYMGITLQLAMRLVAAWKKQIHVR